MQFVGPWFQRHQAELDAQVARLGGATTAFRDALVTATMPKAAGAAAGAAVATDPDPSEIFGTGMSLLRQRGGGAVGGSASAAMASAGEGRK